MRHRRYQVYGRVCESQLELPELAEASALPPGLRVATGRLPRSEVPSWTDHVALDDGSDWLDAAETAAGSWFAFAGLALFRCQSDGSGAVDIKAEPVDGLPGETLRHLLLDEVIPIVLASRGSVVMHGAAVVLDQRAVVLLGPSGHGKSTLAAAFGVAGHPVLADDCVVIDTDGGRRVVQPSYPSVRLGEEAASELFGAGAEGRPFAHYALKHRYEAGMTFATLPMPLGGIVTLRQRTEGDDPRVDVTELRGHAAGAAVLAGAKSMPLGRRKVAAVDAMLTIASSVPVAEITIPDDLRALPEVVDELLRWSAGA